MCDLHTFGLTFDRYAKSKQQNLVGLGRDGSVCAMVLWAGDYRLEEYVGAPGDPCQAVLGVTHNAPEAVTAEINDPAIRKLLARAAGLTNLQNTEGVQLTVSGDGRLYTRRSHRLFTRCRTTP